MKIGIVSTIYPLDSWDRCFKHRAFVAETHFRRYLDIQLCAVKQKPVLFSTPHKEPVRKLALSVFPKDTTTQLLSIVLITYAYPFLD